MRRMVVMLRRRLECLGNRFGGWLGCNAIEKVVDEGVCACGCGHMESFGIFNETSDIDAVRREFDIVPVTKPDIEGFRIDFGVELDGEGSVNREGLRGQVGGGEFAGVGRELPAVVVAFEPRTRWEVVVREGFDVGPAEFWTWAGGDGSAEDAGHELAAETDAEDGNPDAVGCAEEINFGEEPVSDDVVFPNAPRSAHGNDGIECGEVGKLDDHVWSMELFRRHDIEADDFVASLLEAKPDLTTGTDRIVLDEEGAFGTVHAAMECGWRRPTAVGGVLSSFFGGR